MIIAIHQPNFFPWLGYFDKIRKSDFFVFLDGVAYPKSGNSMGSWCNRVKIMIQDKGSWIHCPVIRKHGVQIIKDVRIDERTPWRETLLRTFEFNYKNSVFFEENWEWIESLVKTRAETIAEYNIINIKNIADRIGLKNSFIRQTDLDTIHSSTDLLIEITKKLRGGTYLCGGGAQGYQEDEKFPKQGIRLLYQNFHHPVYQQRKSEFILGLSILDAIFNCGLVGIRTLIMNPPGNDAS